MQDADRDTLDEAYRSVLREGSQEAFDRYLAIGPATVDHLRALKTDGRVVVPTTGFGRDWAESRFALFKAAAARYPTAYGEAFGDDQWIEDLDVVFGLTGIDEPFARERLIDTLQRARSEFARVEAARGLRRFPHPDVIAALWAALDNSYGILCARILDSLQELGEDTVLPAGADDERITPGGWRPPS